MENSGGAVTEPVTPEPHIINIASSTRLELNKTQKDTSCHDDGNWNTNILMSNIELKAKEEETVETGDWELNKQLVQYPLIVEGKVAMLRVAE